MFRWGSIAGRAVRATSKDRFVAVRSRYCSSTGPNLGTNRAQLVGYPFNWIINAVRVLTAAANHVSSFSAAHTHDCWLALNTVHLTNISAVFCFRREAAEWREQ